MILVRYAIALVAALLVPEVGDAQDDPPLPPGAILRLGPPNESRLPDVGRIHLLFSPNGRLIATHSRSRSISQIRIWETETGKRLPTLTDIRGGIFAMAFTQDGRGIGACSSGARLRIWDVSSAKALHELDIQTEATLLAFTPTGEPVTAHDHSHSVHVWDLSSGTSATQEGFRGRFHSLQLRDARELVCLLRNEETFVARIPGKESPVFTVTLTGHPSWNAIPSPDGKTLAVFQTTLRSMIPEDREPEVPGFIEFWSTATGKRTASIPAGASQAAFSPDASRLVTWDENDKLTVWDVSSGKSLLAEPNLSVMSLACSPDGKIFASRMRDGTVLLWTLP